MMNERVMYEENFKDKNAEKMELECAKTKTQQESKQWLEISKKWKQIYNRTKTRNTKSTFFISASLVEEDDVRATVEATTTVATRALDPFILFYEKLERKLDEIRRKSPDLDRYLFQRYLSLCFRSILINIYIYTKITKGICKYWIWGPIKNCHVAEKGILSRWKLSEVKKVCRLTVRCDEK